MLFTLGPRPSLDVCLYFRPWVHACTPNDQRNVGCLLVAVKWQLGFGLVIGCITSVPKGSFSSAATVEISVGVLPIALSCSRSGTSLTVRARVCVHRDDAAPMMRGCIVVQLRGDVVFSIVRTVARWHHDDENTRTGHQRNRGC